MWRQSKQSGNESETAYPKDDQVISNIFGAALILEN